MNPDTERPESPSFDECGYSNDICTRPNDIAGPHYMSTCTLQSLERLKELCRIPPEIIAESKMHGPMESHGVPGGPSLRLGLLLGNSWNCPVPTNPQPSLNYLGEHNCYGGSRIRYRAFIARTLSTEEFIELFKIVFEVETLWNSFTRDRFIEANHKLRMSPPGQLHQLPPPPSLSQGTLARDLASRCKVLSKLMAEACEFAKRETDRLVAALLPEGTNQRPGLLTDSVPEFKNASYSMLTIHRGCQANSKLNDMVEHYESLMRNPIPNKQTTQTY
ncbi:unnamed protein product [Arabidopsis thaliana]|uniref:Uncharacterized protein n=1 Tax=Arabidopsis thaliana TaxID=3702 RepID=A0A5S9WXX4_ARATH|nr:unnamed protein product [Arabidopsis thaliana]